MNSSIYITLRIENNHWRMYKNVVVAFVAILLLGTPNAIWGQSISTIQNLEDINVDDLTDEQIQSYLERAESSGYSEQELELLARARGLSSSQISKLRQRVNEVRGGSSSGGTTSMIDRSRVSPNQQELGDTRSAGFDPFSIIFPEDTLEETNELKVFGIDFFQNPSISFESSLNIATPVDYQIGPGDEIIIDVWGASEQNYQLQVSPEGAVIIPNLGPIYLNGLSVDRAESRIKSRLKNIYSSLGKNTFAQVSLGQIRTVSVNILGEVATPGTYEVSSFTTAFNALYQAGGPSENGSFRKVGVYRAGKEIALLDIYDFLINGTGQNITLQDQDVLLVKPYGRRVALKGEVKRPAYYEMLEGETLQDLLDIAGGVKGNAYRKSISIRRNMENQKTVVTISSSKFGVAILEDGDEVEIESIQNLFTGRVRIEGAVNHPGEFELQEEMTLKEVIELADGLRADAFLQRGVIIRQNSNMTLSNIAFEPSEIMNGQSNLQVETEDLIRIQSIFDLREDYTVSIQGEVLTPGNYPYAEGMTVENLIYLANGFKEAAAKSFVEVARRVTDESGDGASTAEIYSLPISGNLKLNPVDESFELKPFDLVVIRRSPFYEVQSVVEVEGEVQFPGQYVLESKDERISDLLNRSGGPSKYAYIKGATLIRRTEYYTATTDDATDEASRIRKEELRALFERDSSVDNEEQTFNLQESIGIHLDEIIKAPGSKYDLILKEGDVLSIPRQLQTVRIRGEVLYPSTIRYDNVRSFRQYIAQAGGFADRAKKNKCYVIYPNGSAERTKSFLWFKGYPKVDPGTEVIVPHKPLREKLSPQAWIALASSTATLALVVRNLVN